MSQRIAIDARKLPDFGIGSYLRGLLSGLATLDDGHRYLLLAPPGAEALVPGLPARFEWVEERAPHYSAAELAAVSRQARRLGADLLHCPHYVVPFAPPCPVVVTIHDAIHLTHPETLPRPRALSFAYAKLMLARAARIATRVIAVSAAAAEDLQAELRVPPGKLVVIPNGVDERFRAERSRAAPVSLADTATLVLSPTGKEKPIDGDEGDPSPRVRGTLADRPPAPATALGPPSVAKEPGNAPGIPLLWSFSQAPGRPPASNGPSSRAGLAPGYLLFVGNPKPHKNLHRLLAAYASLARGRGARGLPPLVLVGGGREPAEEAALRARVRNLALAERVVFAGLVADEELPEWYRNASMLVFPTLAEGFGLPIAEAMACGTPVVISDRPVHREIAGEAGERVDPLDPASIAAGIARLLDDPELAARRRAAGLRLSLRFSWREAALRTAEVYEQALAAASGRRPWRGA